MSLRSPVAAVPTKLICCLIITLVVLAAQAQAAPRDGPESCRASELREDRLESLDPRGELLLVSGVRAILADIHWPEMVPESVQAAAYLAGFYGRPLTISARGGDDRWGRVRIEAVAAPATDADEPVDLAAGLVAAGLAQADAGESDILCRTDLIALEAEPRAALRGVWREAVRDARDGPALVALAGRFVVAQGRIMGIGERTERTYLDFVRNSADGLTVIVSKRTWRIMRERGLNAATLKGRFARVRGRVEVRRGPTLDIASVDMIEVSDGERALTR